MTQRNFLLGKGERLIEDVIGVRGGAEKHHPYTFAEARKRFEMSRLIRRLFGLSQAANRAGSSRLA